MSQNIVGSRRGVAVGKRVLAVASRWAKIACRFAGWAANLSAAALCFVVSAFASVGFFSALVQPDNNVSLLAHWATGGNDPPNIVGARAVMALAAFFGIALCFFVGSGVVEIWEAFPWRARPSKDAGK